MNVLNRLARNIATNWVGLLVNLAISFFLAPFVVNKLGATYYGVWAVTMQFTGYLYLLDFGVRDAVVRYASKYRAMQAPRRLNEIIRVALEVYFPVFCVALLLAAVGAWIFPFLFSIEAIPVWEARMVVLLVGLTIAQTFVFNVFVGVLHGFHRFDIGNYIGIVFGIIRAIIIVLVLEFGYGIIGLSVVQLLVNLVSGVVGFIIALRIMKGEGFSYRWVVLNHRRRSALFKRMVGYSIYVFINNVGQKTSVAAGALIIAAFLPVASVTPYAIAGSLAGYVKSLILASSWVFNPLVSHYSALKDIETLTGVVRRGAKFALVVGMPVIIAYVLVGDVFIALWMGPDFVIDAAAVLVILALMELVSAPHHVMAAALYGMSKHQALAVFRVVEAVLNVGLSVWLVQVWGILGVAVGAAVPHFLLVLVVLPWILCKFIDVSASPLLRGIFVRPLLGGVPFALAVYFAYGMLPPETLIGFFLIMFLILPVYLVSVAVISLEREERRMINGKLIEWRAKLKGQVNAEESPPPGA